MSITEIKVQGDSDKVYTIAITNDAATCSCPAFRFIPGPCKHMEFVVAQMRGALQPA